MTSRSSWSLAALALAGAACSSDGAGPWNDTPNGPTEVEVFSKNTSVAPDPSGNKFGNRFGPWSAPYNDVIATGYAPSTEGSSGATPTPYLVVWPLALDLTGAINLETGAEVWRHTEAFTTAATNGTVVCGVVGLSTQSSTVVCLDVQTGVERWRKVLMAWLEPPQGQGYGLAAELVFRGDRLFIRGGGQVFSLALATGDLVWSAQVFPKFRGLTFVGDDLVLEGARGCTQGNSCLRAVDPLTGALLVESPTETASFLWQLDGKAFFQTPTNGVSRSVVAYDAAANTFGADSSYDATFANANVSINTMLAGLTPVLPDGAVLLYTPSSITDDLSFDAARICRYLPATRTMGACAPAPAVRGSVRLYQGTLVFGPSRGAYSAGLRLAYPAIDQPSSGRSTICFGATCFTGGESYAYYR